VPGTGTRPRSIESGAAVIGVLTVDDDPGFLRLAREVVTATPGFDPVGEAATGEAALALVDELRPQLVLMDVRLPGIGGIEAARRIADQGRDDVAVVLMSADPTLLVPEVLPSETIAVLRKERLTPTALRELWPG
jgi:DNA-binding NarL/FixJ family response regulator